ncbi:MAG: VWA domain-containing protein [Bacteroidota bacterium]
MKSLVPSFWLLITICSILPLSAQRKATILDHKDRIQVSRLSILNSKARETNLSITPDGNYLFFMSLRGEQVWSRPYMIFEGDSVYDGDIWYSRKINGKWGKPKCLPYGINSAMGEDEPNISANGSSLYFQSWNINWEYTGGPYYKTKRQDQDWGRPKGLGGGITEFFSRVQATDGMTLSPDERMFFVAAGNEYDEPMDIFISKLTGMGWTFCRRLPISTEGDERSVFMAGDGKTLYFASDGYEGLGGLDIYKTTIYADGSIGEVINIGAPFNTSGDDYGFTLTADGMEAYFIRNGDIYFADLKEADDRIRPTPLKIEHTIAGYVKDSLNFRGLQAEIMVLDARTKIPIKRLRTKANGTYDFKIPNRAAIYDEIVICNGYKKKTRRIKVQAISHNQKISSNFLLGKDRPAIVQADPEPKPDPKPVTPPVAVTPKPDPTPPSVIQPIEEKAPVTIDEPVVKNTSPVTLPKEDPYSFDGIAQNNLVLLVDVSASMRRPDRLPVLKESMRELLSHMRPEDQISVIVYSNETKVLVTAVSALRKEEIVNAIDRFGGSGGTKSKSALRTAYSLAKDYYIPGGNNRIIMATDGYFEIENVYKVAERISDDQIALSVFSFGKLAVARTTQLKSLAAIGSGNYANVNRTNIEAALLKEAKAVRSK